MMYDANNECWEDTSPEVEQVSRAMDFSPDFALDIRELAPPPASERTHQHIAIQWAGGVLWLDMSVQHDHYCIDVRQFTPHPEPDVPENSRYSDLKYADAQLAGQGVFTIVNGRRQQLGKFGGTVTYTEPPLKDPDGTPVRGHGWNGGYVVTLMHDKAPSERQTNRPAGPGRG